MEKIWFIYFDGMVLGPFSTDRVQANLISGKWDIEKTKIWKKNQKEWITLGQWTDTLKSMLHEDPSPAQGTWHAEQDGVQVGPLSRTELIAHLRSLKNVRSIRLWTTGSHQWTNLYEYNEILTELGISKRSYARAPITGKVSILKNHKTQEKVMTSVSGGGVGIQDGHDFIPGEVLTVTVQSPLIVTPVRGTAKVVYVQDSGYTGLQFQTIHIEAKSALIDYVKQFS